MHRMRVLITNAALDDRAGSEMFVRDLALGLMRRGHEPVCYSPALGEVANELRGAGARVTDDLGALPEEPDLIHGQHHVPAMTAMLHFPRTPALFMCHGVAPWEEAPPAYPSVLRYVAVDDACRERVLAVHGVDHRRVRTIYNAVDLRRFVPRGPLPARPVRALVFSNAASDSRSVEPIRTACEARGIALDVAGRASGLQLPAPEAILGRYDIVFAKARAALEAMAVGCAVVVADAAGFAGLVTPASLARMRPLNFGLRTMEGSPVTTARALEAIDAYDADSCQAVSRWIREHAGLEQALDHILTIYAEVLLEASLEGQTPQADAGPGIGPSGDRFSREAGAAAARYVTGLGRHIRDTRTAAMHWQHQLHERTAEVAALRRELELMREDRNVIHARLSAVQQERDAVLTSTTWRAFSWYRRLRGLAARRHS